MERFAFGALLLYEDDLILMTESKERCPCLFQNYFFFFFLFFFSLLSAPATVFCDNVTLISTFYNNNNKSDTHRS